MGNSKREKGQPVLSLFYRICPLIFLVPIMPIVARSLFWCGSDPKVTLTLTLSLALGLGLGLTPVKTISDKNLKLNAKDEYRRRNPGENL